MSKIILLSRVSTGLQDLEQQTEQLINYAKAIGYQEEDFIVIEDKESAVKLSEEERQGLNKMKEAIATYPVKDVVIYELSRLSRVPKILYSVRDFLVEHNVQLHILNPHIKLLKQDGTIDESANVIFSLFCSLAENEGYLRKQRFARGKAKLRNENKFIGGNMMFGYTVNKDKEFIILEKEGNIVRRIFNEYQTKTIVDIAKDLVLEGLMPNANVNSAATLVRAILHRELYYGKEVVIKGYKRKYPAIITKQEFDEAAKKMHERKKYNKTKSKHDYLCRGIVYNINNEQLKPLYCHNSYAFIKINKYSWETLSVNMNLLDSIAFHYAIENRKRHPEKDLAKIKAEFLSELKSVEQKISNIKQKIALEQDKLIKVEMRFISGKISESTADLLNLKIQESIEQFVKTNNELDESRSSILKRLQLLKQEDASLMIPLFEDDYKNISQFVHQEIERIIVIKGSKKFTYTFGIQFNDGDYVMVDVNSQSKKLYQDGVEVTYKNLLTSQQGGT